MQRNLRQNTLKKLNVFVFLKIHTHNSILLEIQKAHIYIYILEKHKHLAAIDISNHKLI